MTLTGSAPAAQKLPANIKQAAPGAKKRGHNFILVLFITICCVAMYFLPTGFEQQVQKSSHYAKAKITAVDNSDVEENLINPTGLQTLCCELISGPNKGLTTTRAMNHLTGKMEMDEFYIPGRTILLEYTLNDKGQITYALARGNHRLGITWALMGMFTLLLLLVAGWTGVKAVLSFVFSVLMIWKVMIPLYLKGWDPVYTGLAAVLIMVATITFLVGGVNKRGLVSFAGSLLGLALTCVMAGIFTGLMRLHGAVRPFAEQLLYSGFFDINLTRLFQAAIVTGAAGAVVDLSMDISASMDELRKADPNISLRRHMAAGMSVGRSVIGTMTTTLLFAYSGSYLAMLMLFMGRGVPPHNFLNIHFVSAEILNVMIGSFGLVTVAPFTVLVGGLLYGRKTKPVASQQAASNAAIIATPAVEAAIADATP